MKKGKFVTNSAEETLALAKSFAKGLQGDEIVCLSGDLGAGKTVFAKGVAEALGITDVITSPTYIYFNSYSGGKYPLLHFDLYRIENINQAEEHGIFEALEERGIKLVEWGRMINLLGDITVDIKNLGGGKREIEVK